MRTAGDRHAGLIALAAGGALALNYPLLALFDRDVTVLGIPLPFVHLFAVWALLIVGVARLVEGPAEHDAPVAREPADTDH